MSAVRICAVVLEPVRRHSMTASALAVLAGWALPGTLLAEELRLAPASAARLKWVLRWLVPAGILAAALAPLFVQA